MQWAGLPAKYLAVHFAPKRIWPETAGAISMSRWPGTWKEYSWKTDNRAVSAGTMWIDFFSGHRVWTHLCYIGKLTKGQIHQRRLRTDPNLSGTRDQSRGI